MFCSKCGSSTNNANGVCNNCNPTLQIKIPQYVVIQTVLKEKLIGTGSGNLSALESAINAQAAKGFRLHTITTASGGSKGLGGGDRIQATMVFEKL